MNCSDAQNIFELAKRKGLMVFPVFQNRYNQAVARVRRGIIEGELGKVRIISIRVRCAHSKNIMTSRHGEAVFHDGGASQPGYPSH